MQAKKLLILKSYCICIAMFMCIAKVNGKHAGYCYGIENGQTSSLLRNGVTNTCRYVCLLQLQTVGIYEGNDSPEKAGNKNSRFWETWWFISLLIAGFTYLLIFIIRTREYRFKKKSLELEKIVGQRAEEVDSKNKKLIAQTQKLNSINQLLVERQKYIEEQAEELKKQKEALEESNTALMDSNKTKDKLFSIISHDLRSPFASILGFSELLMLKADSWDYDKIQKFTKQINVSAQRVYDLIENLLLWARTQQQGINLSLESINLSNIVQQNVDLFKESANAKSINLTAQSLPPTHILADRNMLFTALRNLINNALKFTPEHGTISIEYKEEDYHVIISVKDTGIGIPAEFKDKIFSPSPHSTIGTNHEKGTGLGLLICKEFIEGHQGEIWFTSETNKGTCFYIKLPKKHEPEKQPNL